MNRERQLLAISIVLALLNVEPCHAEDFPERTALHNRSLTEGFGRSSVELLNREPGPGGMETATSLLANFSEGTGLDFELPGEIAWTEESDRGLRVKGAAGWTLVVLADGSAARVDRYGYLDTSPRRPKDDPLGRTDLEVLGRAFIENELADFVKVGVGETLTPLKTEHQVETIRSRTALISEEVVASTIVFGRTFDGAHVLGAGSKIMITFANDGVPVAFAFDWPRYSRTGFSQNVLGLSEIQERASAHASMRFNSDTVETRRFQCGYVDFGARLGTRDETAPIQAGCWIHYIGYRLDEESIQGATPTAYSEAFPAGEIVEMDYGWPQALAIASGNDICQESDLTAEVLD